MKKLFLLLTIIIGANSLYAGFPIAENNPPLEQVEVTNEDNTLSSAVGVPEFQTGAFLMGLFLSLIGVLLVYLITKDKSKRYWVWYGAAISGLISLLFI